MLDPTTQGGGTTRSPDPENVMKMKFRKSPMNIVENRNVKPMDSDGMLSTCDSDQPMAEGPVGQYITCSPVGSDGMLSTCDSDQPGSSVILGLVGLRRMLSQCKPDQPMADGPVGQSFTPGPVGPCGIVSKCEPNDPITDSPVGSTDTPDPVDQKERPIQIDIMKIVTTDEPASLVGTPPSSDSGIHSCDTRVPPNTEYDQVIIFPWMDCLLKRESSRRQLAYGIFILTGNRRRRNRRGRITRRARII